MKKIALIICFSLCFAVSAFGGDTRKDLPATWPQALKNGAERMMHTGVAPKDSISMTRLMSQAGFDDNLILKAQDIVIDAHQKGLPTRAIMDKAFEGIAKHVSPLLVVKAMERVSARYNYSFDLARRLADDDTEINHLGQVLAMGITAGLRPLDVEKVVDQLIDRSNKEKPIIRYALASETFLTVRDMARQGVSSKMAADVVTRALQKGFSVGEMKSMHHTFVSRARQSSAEHLAKSFSKAIQQGKMSQNASNMGKPGHEGGSGVTGNPGAGGGSGGSGSPGESGGSGDGIGGSGGSGGSGSGPGGSGGSGPGGGGGSGGSGGNGGPGGGGGGSGGGT